jgi:uncharacterized protein
MKNNLQLAILVSVALAMFVFTLFWFRPVSSKLTRVTVTGEAQTKVSPDSAKITFSVITQNQQAVAAQQENARKSQAVQTAVESVAATLNPEIKTNNYNLQPEQDYSGKVPKIVGYEARNSVTVTVNDLTAVGAVIDAATKAGANSVEGIAFVVSENSPAQGDALGTATRQAMAKAESVARSLKGRVVRVVETQEGGVNLRPQTPDYYATSTMNSNAAVTRQVTTPVEAGSLDVRSQVVLIVEIEPGR